VRHYVYSLHRQKYVTPGRSIFLLETGVKV
jgi:hypothetical protein